MIAADNPVTCAIYARDKDLLNKPGWKRFKKLAKRQKKLFHMVNQAKLHSHRTTPKCKWSTVECDSACGWAIKIYEKLKTDLEVKKIKMWYDSNTLMNCQDCKVEHGCCKKMKLTLAMTSQILDWLKWHQQQFNSIESGGY